MSHVRASRFVTKRQPSEISLCTRPAVSKTPLNTMETPRKDPSSNSTPRTPNSTSSQDPYYQASECLRKLKQEIAIFRDPNVRSYLQALPLQISSSTPLRSSISSSPFQSSPAPNSQDAPAIASPTDGAKSTPSNRTIDEQNAIIIALRTTVRTMEDSVRELEAADLRTRKRAARAEGQLSELQAQRDAQERAHRAAIDEAAQRIRLLETEATTEAQKAENEQSRLMRSAENSRTECTRLTNRLVRMEKRADLAEQQINTMSNELNITRETHAAETRAIRKARIDAEEREKEIRSLLEEQSSVNPADNSVSDSIDELQKQNVKLKSEIEWLSKRNNLVQKSLTHAEEERDSLRLRIREASQSAAAADRLRERVKNLETAEKELSNTKQLVDALQVEKDEMKRMIVALSSSGDNVEEGVSVLKILGNRQSDRVGFKKLWSEWMPNEQPADGKENEAAKGDSDVQMTESESVAEAENQIGETVNTLKSEVERSRTKITSLESELAALKLSTRRPDAKENCNDQAAEKDKTLEGPPDFDSKVCKVFHLPDNPLSHARRAAAEKAKAEENMRGKKRGRRPSENEGDDEISVVVIKEEVEQLRTEVKTLRDEQHKLKHQAILGDRMRLVAVQRIEAVRSAVYNLFGWSMRINGKLYCLSSIYAESETEVLHFRVNDQGGIALMDCEYAHHISSELEQYVEKMDSFPALLSHLTMTNLEKTNAG